jgi:polyisoprenoid-binding protein YceI
MKWNIDNAHSNVEFAVKHMMISTVKGRFAKFSGSFDFEETSAAADSVEATIEVASIDTRDEKRDGHLSSPDFFDAATFPTITFKSTQIEKTSDNEFKVTGDLTIRDVTQPAVLDVEYNGQSKSPWGMTVAGFSAKTSVNRKDFGLNWNVALETGGFLVGDKINISLEIEGVAQAAQVPA